MDIETKPVSELPFEARHRPSPMRAFLAAADPELAKDMAVRIPDTINPERLRQLATNLGAKGRYSVRRDKETGVTWLLKGKNYDSTSISDKLTQ